MDWFVFLKVAYLFKKEHVISNFKGSLSLKEVAMKYL